MHEKYTVGDETSSDIHKRIRQTMKFVNKFQSAAKLMPNGINPSLIWSVKTTLETVEIAHIKEVKQSPVLIYDCSINTWLQVCNWDVDIIIYGTKYEFSYVWIVQFVCNDLLPLHKIKIEI